MCVEMDFIKALDDNDRADLKAFKMSFHIKTLKNLRHIHPVRYSYPVLKSVFKRLLSWVHPTTHLILK